jgi:hypothetical protein
VSLTTWGDIVSIGANFVTILTIPTALVTYVRRKNVEEFLAKQKIAELQREADDLAHARLFEDYNSFLRLVMVYPQFDFGDVALEHAPDLDELDHVRFLSLFNIFLSVAERAFLLFDGASNEMKERQWGGWRTYIVSILERPRIKDAYLNERSQYDREFIREIDTWLQARRLDDSP